MKKVVNTLALLAVFTAVPVILTGCAKDGYEQAAVTRDSVTAFRASLTELSSQVNVTNASMLALLNDSSTDPTARFKSFSDAVDKLVSADKNAKSKGEDVQSNAKKTVEDREKAIGQIGDAKIRQTATEQKEAYAKQFQNVKTTTEEASTSTKTYIAKILDLRSLLSADLSANGLSKAKSFSSEITDMGKEAVKNIDALSTLVAKVASNTSHAVAAPAAPAPAPAATN